jgi:predicted transposase YdaD
MILAGLRGVEEIVRAEAKLMPILNDIMDHKVIGPAIREGLELGRREGAEQGRRDEAFAILRRQITKRFGPIPALVEVQLKQLSAAELEDLGERFVDAKSLAELFDQ